MSGTLQTPGPPICRADAGARALPVAPTYQEKRVTMSDLVAALPASTVDEAGLAGEWELVYSDVELFRSSPFFLAIEVMRHPAKGAAVACCLPHTVAIAPSPVHSRHSSVPPTTAGCARQLARHPSAGQVARADGPHAEVGALLQAPPAAGGRPTAPSHAPTASSAAATATTARDRTRPLRPHASPRHRRGRCSLGAPRRWGASASG